MAYDFPHVMERGMFAGRRFETRQDYYNALRRLKTKAGANGNGNGHADVQRIVDAYEVCMEQGLGRRASVRIIDKLIHV